jgi:hypothetical protein
MATLPRGERRKRDSSCEAACMRGKAIAAKFW